MEQCKAYEENHGVDRRCILQEGHSGDHEHMGSAGMFRSPNREWREKRRTDRRRKLMDDLEVAVGDLTDALEASKAIIEPDARYKQAVASLRKELGIE